MNEIVYCKIDHVVVFEPPVFFKTVIEIFAVGAVPGSRIFTATSDTNTLMVFKCPCFPM